MGYTSATVGDGGLEAAYVDELRSRRDLTFSDLVTAILGRDLRPRSIRTTIHRNLQRIAFEAGNGQQRELVAGGLLMRAQLGLERALLVGRQ